MRVRNERVGWYYYVALDTGEDVDTKQLHAYLQCLLPAWTAVRDPARSLNQDLGATTLRLHV